MSSDSRKRRRPIARDPSKVAEPPPPPYAHAPVTARVFQSGNSQAVRLPKQFRLRSKEVQIFRRGGDLILREQPARLSDLLSALPKLPDDALPDEIPDYPAEPVEEL
jgi:antitoxin VapB